MGFSYFERLNYTLANEDASLEVSVLSEEQKKVVAVGGSGSRVLPYLSKCPNELHIVDISIGQIALCELRIETLRALERDDFLRFWYPWLTPFNGEDDRVWRKKIFFKLPLSERTRNILSEAHEKQGWQSLTLTGKWEKTFCLFSKVIRGVLGKKHLDMLFSFSDLSEQREYFRTRFPHRRFRLLLSVLGSAKTFNVLLYRGKFPKNNSGIPYVRHYEGAFSRLFQRGLASRNFFLQLSLLGSILNGDSLPLEVQPGVYESARENLKKVKVFFHHGDVVTLVEQTRGVDFVSLSNVAAYFTGSLEREFLKRIRTGMVPGGRVVMRHYLHYPESLNREGFSNLNGRFAEAIYNEGIQMYDPEILECMF